MEWSTMEPIGASFILGDMIEDTYVPASDCEDVLEELLDLLLKDDQRNSLFRRRLAIEKIVEKDVIPLIKATQEVTVFYLAIRLFALMTQPVDISIPGGRPHNATVCSEIDSLIVNSKSQCTDIAFFKAVSNVMKEILKKEELEVKDGQCLTYCVLLLRNLLHLKSGTAPNEQTSIAHQCLLSSFFMSEMDKIIVTMLQHKYKEIWTIGIAQLISFIFKDYSSNLLEPDIDDATSASSSDEPQDLVDLLTSPDTNTTGSSSRHLSSKFKDKLQICSSSGGSGGRSSNASGDDDFILEFNSTVDGQLEIKLRKCQQDNVEEMDEGEHSAPAAESTSAKQLGHGAISGSNSSLDNAGSWKEGEYLLLPGADEKEVMSSMHSSSCLMDMDIFVSYLKKFATDIVYSGLVELIENIMRALLTNSEAVLDHSFLIWTVGFFLSFAHQQELDFLMYKEILNLDLFGFLVFEGVKSCESLFVRHQQKKDCSVDKHRLHLVVCTLNQMFRTILANSKIPLAYDYLQNLQKCLSHMTDLQNLFVLLIQHHVSSEQSMLYLRDLVQTNHMLMLMVEEWLASRYIGENMGFSMVNHVNKFATKQIMAKYGSLLENQEPNKETLNIAVLTMMYHVAGDCRKQDTLMQIPILKAFSEIWMENAVREHNEFKDLVEFVLETFMSDVEQDPNGCAQNLFPEDNCSSKENAKGSPVQLLSGEEEVLILTWTSEVENCADISGMVMRKLKEHGLTPSPEAVTKFLTDNNILAPAPTSSSSTTSSSSSSISAQSPWAYSESSENPTPLHENTEILHQLSSVSEDNLIPFLLDKLRGRGFESHLVWLQKQLLETAYVKLGMKEPVFRVHLEEPVIRFYALQGKSIPMVLWNEDLQRALTDPYFQLLQQSLGLYTCDDPNIMHPRIPHYLTPTLLVNKARQIGSIESLPVKFDVHTLKEGSDFDIVQDDTPRGSSHKDMNTYNKPIRNMEFHWLSMVRQVNEGTEHGSC